AGATAAATRVMTTSEESIADEEGEKKKRSPWTWPLIALIVLLLLVLGGTIWAIMANQGDPEPGPSTSSATPTTRPTNTTTPTPEPTTANVVEADYVGMTCEEASTALDALGMGANCAEGDAAPTEADQGRIYRVNPTGNVPISTIIELTVYGGQVPMPGPTAPSITGTVQQGATAQVTWGGYSCPAGTGSVSAYNFTATNGVFPTTGQSTASFGPNERTGSIQVTGTAGQALIVTYTVTCSGGTAGERTSGASGEASTPIEAPAPTPGPTDDADADDEG
ncbi:PASTA domain-containing protein, partial [Microbacterium sp. CPCC 204701]|uniref:PASTA domain-containing protein n=1 Tax=Microbacterium sp. CPCC 204701 TaxID=2493084 RepID=UPI00197BE367